MSCLASDLKWQNAASHPESNSGTAGGVRDATSIPTFVDPSPAGQLQVVSSSASDTAITMTLTGKKTSGVAISEVLTLTGTTAVLSTSTDFERLLKSVKSGVSVGDVCVEEVTANRSNTAVGGGLLTASSMAYIDLDASASAVDSFYNGMIVRITSGTGANQIRSIVSYIGSTKRASVQKDWTTAPDATSVFRVCDGMVLEPATLIVKRIAYAAAAEASGGSLIQIYSKVFCLNSHATKALTGAIISKSTETGAATGTFTAAVTDICAANAHGLLADSRVTLTTTGTLPAGLSGSVVYFARDITTNSFKLSTTSGGTATDITDTGTGTHTFIAHNFLFAISAAVDDSVSVASRLTAPATITFDTFSKAVTGTDLAPGTAIGVWILTSLPAGSPASDTTVPLSVTGSST